VNEILDVVLPAAGVCSLAANALAIKLVRRLRNGLADARRRAVTDPLTGLANRAGFQQSLESFDGESYDLVLVDLDKFKQVNDTYGHAAGDALLVEISRRLADVLVDIDGAVVARLGGDEFVLACPSPAPLAEILGAEVIQALAEPIDVGSGVQIAARASVGAVHAAAGSNPAGVLAAADAAAYEAKARGGDALVEHAALSELPEVEFRPLVRLRELAALTRLLGATA
jgi:diguanylate cyclase (GGDEF)-like protein